MLAQVRCVVRLTSCATARGCTKRRISSCVCWGACRAEVLSKIVLGYQVLQHNPTAVSDQFRGIIIQNLYFSLFFQPTLFVPCPPCSSLQPVVQYTTTILTFQIVIDSFVVIAALYIYFIAFVACSRQKLGLDRKRLINLVYACIKYFIFFDTMLQIIIFF